MTQTLRRELRKRFFETLVKYNWKLVEEATFLDEIAGSLADAALSVAGIAKIGRSPAWDLAHGLPVEAQPENDPVENVLVELEQGLHVNLGRSLRNQTIAKKIIKTGQPVAGFITWVYSEEWRAAHAYLYRDLEKLWGDWPTAFADVKPERKAPATLERNI